MARKGHGRPASLVNIGTHPDDGSSPVGSNEWNANRDTTGIIGFTKKQEAISSNNINITDSYVEVTNAGTIHTMSQVTTALSTTNYVSDTTTKSFAEGDLLYLVKETDGHTITLKNQQGGAGSGKITTLTGGDLLLDVKIPRIFICRTIGSNQEWVEYGGGTASDLDTTNFAAATLVTESEGIGSNDNDTTMPTSAAVKDYVDTHVATENTIDEMNDTTITSVGDNEILQYNSSSSVWENQTLTEAGLPTLTGVNTFSGGTCAFANSTSTSITSPSIYIGDGDTIYLIGSLGSGSTLVKDEDNMASDSATHLVTQQSVKAYVDAQIATEDTIAELNDTTISGIASGELLKWSGSAWINQTLTEAGIVDGNLGTPSALVGTNISGTAANLTAGNATLAATSTALATARTIGGTSFDGTANIAVALSATATALATARTIGGVSFDGTANIDLPGVNTAGNQNTSGTAATVTGAAQTAITSVGTLTALAVDNVTVDGNKIEVTNTNANLQLDSNGTGVIEILGNTNDGAITLNCTANSHGQTIKSQPHSATTTNTMLLPQGASSTLVSLVSADTLTNKTLGTGTTLTLGSDAAIDIYYRSSGGALARLAKGTAGQALKINSGANGLEWGSAGGGATLFHTYSNSTTTTYAGQTGESQTLGTAVGTLASGSGDRDVYIRKIDTNNEGVFAVIHKNGSLVEVQVA